jgi:hypothetical protein
MPKFEGFDGSIWVTLGGGTVTSVGITGSTGLGVTGSPITTNGTINLTLGSELQALSAFASTGLIARTGSSTYAGRSLTAGTGIGITNGDGILGNPTISVSTIDINTNTTGSLLPSRISGYPSNASVFLNGLGSWSLVDINNGTTGNLAIPRLAGYAAAPTTTFLKGDATWSLVDINNNTTSSLLASRISGYPSNSSLFLNGLGSWTAPSFSNLITTSDITYALTINNTNASATATSFYIQNNGVSAADFGYNTSTNEAYVWAYGTASLKFGTANIKRMQLLSTGTLDLLTNNLITSGNISATTGTLIGNNLATYNAGAIVVLSSLSMGNNGITGLPNPINNQDAATKFYVDNSSAGAKSILHGYNATTYTANVAVGDHIKFDSSVFTRGTAITLDTSSTYSSSTNTASVGRITLAAGKTYKLVGSINNVVSASYNATRWYNSDTGATLGLISGASPPISTTDRSPGAGTVAYITTSVSTRVELRITYNAFSSVNGTSDFIGTTWFTVEEV